MLIVSGLAIWRGGIRIWIQQLCCHLSFLIWLVTIITIIMIKIFMVTIIRPSQYSGLVDLQIGIFKLFCFKFQEKKSETDHQKLKEINVME